MLIVHRLLETFNQEVNNFVDLESHQINFYSNKDLPKNIFDDPENWFFETSPNELYKLCQTHKTALDAKWNDPMLYFLENMHKSANAINQIRFTAADFIAANDLNERSNQEKIYEILEQGVKLFENFYLEQEKLKEMISSYLTEKNQEPKPDAVREIHENFRSLLADIRYKKDTDWGSKLASMEKNFRGSKFNAETMNKITLFLNSAKKFIKTGEVSADYKQYGKHYYYHNSKLLNYANRYGNGYVNGYNKDLDSDTEVKLIEVPHFYKVIYPKKLIEDVPTVGNDPIIVEIPKKLLERKIIVSDRIIYVDNEKVEFEIFDHKMIDGDIVSVNFNGDWILEKYALKGKAKKINLVLNKKGKNYILLHAVNLGSRPPNTMALRYTYKDKVETVVLSSDLDESEVIELIVND